MQNVDSNKENENPQHFPTDDTATKLLHSSSNNDINTNDTNSNDIPLTNHISIATNGEDLSTYNNLDNTSTTAPRPKFSFASDYTPSRHFSSSFAAPSYPYESNYTTNPVLASSFTVLNNDYGGSAFTSKPNAIVHPIRRSEETALPNSNVLGRELRITGYPAPGSLSVTHPQYGRDVRNFAEELKRKLSFLDESSGSRELGLSRFKNSPQNGSNQEALYQRPLFITTVPRGIFLPPPKEITLVSPTRKRQLYAYSSHPVVYNATTTSSSSYQQQQQQPHQHEQQQQQQQHTTDHQYTHNSHKLKATSHHHHQYSQRNYSPPAMAKDKYQNIRSGGGGGGVGGFREGASAGGGSGGGRVVIASADKDLSATYAATTTLQQQRPNGVRGSYASATTTTTMPNAPALGGISITKQQFQQQLEQSRSKRETPPAEPYKNVMYDRRVIRGTNYGSNPLLGDYDPFNKAAEFRRRQALRKKNVSQKNQRNVLGTPPPVTGRRHEDVQTEKYLEELVTRPPDFSVETQTDLFLEKPPTPPYVPAKIGVDVGTEILDGELFQFDAEAQPIIDVLVDSTLELSILEVAHEQEIDLIRQRQAELLAHREAELAELRRLEAEEIRLQAEKERRLRQDSIAKSLDDEMQQGVTAAKLLQGHIASILPEILDNLEPATDAAKKEKLMQTLCPWLSAEVAQEVGHIVDSREILTVIIQEIIKQRAEVYADYKEESGETKLEHIDEEEHETTEEACEPETEEEPTGRCPPEV